MSSLGRIMHYRMMPVNSEAGRGITHAVDKQLEKASTPKRKRKTKRQTRAVGKGPARHAEPKPKHICGLCGVRVALGEMKHHFKRHHPHHKPGKVRPKVACPCCPALVRTDRIQRHLRTAHPEAEVVMGSRR